MVKRDAMVQLQDDNAEYPFLHVHTESGQDIDPVTFQPVNIVHGYAQQHMAQKPKPGADDIIDHVHTWDGTDVDMVHGNVVNVEGTYAQQLGKAHLNSFNADAEYPYLHVHGEDGVDRDPVNGEIVNIVKGYNKQPLKRIVAV